MGFSRTISRGSVARLAGICVASALVIGWAEPGAAAQAHASSAVRASAPAASSTTAPARLGFASLARSPKTVPSSAVIRPATSLPPAKIGHIKKSGNNSYAVYLGYADTLRPNPVNFPTPWDGSPNVVFEGCDSPCSGGLDGGAVEIINTSTAAETFNSVVISYTSACVYDIWPHTVSVPKGDELIITENAGGGPGGCTVSSGQMDSSDIGPGGANWAGNCTQSGIIPSIAVTENNTQTVLNDSTQVLNTGGVDANSCGHPNESEQWTPIGSSVCYGATLTATPASQSLLPGANATVTAKLLNSCGDPLQGVTVDLNVTSGPNSGTAVSGTTGSNGGIKLTYSGALQGIDTDSVTVTNTAGTITAAPVSVVWETATLTLTPTSGLPGSTVTFTGSGYSAGETVLVDENSVGGTLLATVTASATGKISGSFTVPPPTGSGAMTAAVAIGQTSFKEGWAAFSSGCTDDWTNAAGGNWTTASDWSTGAVPGGSDVACVVLPGTYAVVMNNSETVSGLTLGTSATKSPGTQTLDLRAAAPGSLTFSFGAATVGAHGVFNMDSGDADAYSLVNGGTLINSGTFETSQGDGSTRYLRANVVNKSTGTVVIGAADTRFDEAFSFTNNGSFTVSAGGGFSTNGAAVFSQSSGTLVNHGSMLVNDATFDQSGGADSGSAITVEASSLNDSAGAGSFLFQCSDNLSGTVPVGQSIDIQANGCGNATANLVGNVTNDGTLTLDSTDADASAYLTDTVSADALTNNGTLQTVAGAGGTRFIRLNVTNGAGGSVAIGAADGRFDQGYIFTNDGSLTIAGGAELSTNGNATFAQSGGTLVNNGTMFVLSTTFNESGGSESGNAVTMQNSTLNDSAGTGSFLLQCSNNLSGTVPAGQTVDTQANGCGSATTQLLGNVTNDGTLTLDSAAPDEAAYLDDSVGTGVLTNDGTLQTVQDGGSTRYIRSNVVNDADGTVLIGAADSLFDQGYTFTNNGTFTVSASGGFSTNGNASFIQSGGTLTNNGSMLVLSTTLDVTGGSLSGNAIEVQNTTMNDAAGGGSFVAQCGNSLSGTIPAGQSIDVEGNGCGSAALTLLGNVTNAGTLSLDSVSADDYSLVEDSVSGDTLTNDGTLQTLQNAGNIRYIRLNVMNDPDGTVLIGATASLFDQGYTFTNNGTFTITAGAGFDTNGNATFTQSGGTLTDNGSMLVLGTTFNQSGGHDSGNAITAQNTTVNDAAGTGSFLFQCANDLSGTIPAGQSIDIQANACGNSSTTLLGNVTNNGTLSLDSTDADSYSLINDSVGGDSLTNNGTLQTVAGAGGIRYLRVNVANSAGATVDISAAATLQDSGTTDSNAGIWNIKDGGELSLSGSSSFVESSGAKLGVTIDTSIAGGGITGGIITVAGTLTVTTVGTPATGTAYTVLSSPGGNFSGTFSTIKTGSTGYTAAYASTGLTLTAT